MSDEPHDDAGRCFPLVRLWKRVGRDGRPFFSGVLGGARVLIVENRDRADEADADWQLLIGSNHHPRPRQKPKETSHEIET